MMDNALNAYETMVNAVTVAVGLFCIMKGEIPACSMAMAGITMSMPLITTFINLSIAAGVLLAIYIPLYPVIVFLFCVLSWFISVVEAMVAGPLICIGITHPKGHDFLGKAEQAMMLLLSVFLRPVLIIIALFVAAALSYVATRFAITAFIAAMNQISDPTAVVSTEGVMTAINSMAKSSSVMGRVITFPALIALMAILIIKVLEMSFSLLSVLPTQILLWIGGPASSDQSLNAARSVQSSMASAGDKMGSAVSDAGTAQVKEGAGLVKEKMDRDERDGKEEEYEAHAEKDSDSSSDSEKG
jgi:conjugal transfer/type IV secretion protein DotA/TraY